MKQKEFRLNRKALFGVMVLAAAGAMPVQAATIAADPAAADGVAGDTKCSLREAVIQVNAGMDSDDCKNTSADAYGTNDTITLAAGTYNLTVTGLDEGWVASAGAEPYVETNTPDATKGDIDILKSVRIVGAGADATTIQWDAAVADADRDRIFHVFTTALAAVVDVAIEGVTIQGGRTFEEFIEFGPDNPVSPVVQPTEYYLRRAGGGLAVGPAANVVQVDPALEGTENSAGRGGSKRPTEPDEGGATFSLTLTGAKVKANQAEGDGAGIYTGYPMTATNVEVSGNSTTINGGGIYNEGRTTISNSTVSGNIAEGGGGLFLTGSNIVKVVGSTLSANRAVGGGALSGRTGVTVNIDNSTLSGNLARDVGAGFYSNGPANLRFVTIANNVSGGDAPSAGSGINTFNSGATEVTVKNVLLGANKRGFDAVADPATPELYRTVAIPQPGTAEFAALLAADCGATGGGTPAVTSRGYNLSSDTTCDAVLIQATDIKNVDPKIAALADNGGPTLTHALASDSPALGKGDAEIDITTDQRGVTRQDPPDIGAYEFVPAPAGGGGGGGCAIGNDGRLDPTLPAMLAAALAFLGWRRRAAK